MKFLGVLLDENLSWKAHIDTIGKKISKNLGILYKGRRTLNQKSTKQLYFSFIHSYLTYGSMAWASTNKTKLNNLLMHQKHAARIIFFKDKLTHAKPTYFKYYYSCTKLKTIKHQTYLITYFQN